jgi:hypothetical protein
VNTEDQVIQDAKQIEERVRRWYTQYTLYVGIALGAAAAWLVHRFFV